MARIETIDKQKFNEFFYDDLDSDNEQLERLLNIFENQYSDFKKVCEGSSFDDLSKACHRLKSSCHSFGASALLKEIQSLEHAAREKRQVEELKEKSLTLFSQTLEELKEILKKIKEES